MTLVARMRQVRNSLRNVSQFAGCELVRMGAPPLLDHGEGAKVITVGDVVTRTTLALANCLAVMDRLLFTTMPVGVYGSTTARDVLDAAKVLLPPRPDGDEASASEDDERPVAKLWCMQSNTVESMRTRVSALCEDMTRMYRELRYCRPVDRRMRPYDSRRLFGVADRREYDPFEPVDCRDLSNVFADTRDAMVCIESLLRLK